MKQISSSFRDPSGYIFQDNGKIFRQINPSYFETYEDLLDKGIYKILMQEGLLVQHTEVHRSSEAIILQPQMVPFISYPYEWSFSQLKDAALLTLHLQERLVNLGFSLKDASAYNVQFLGYKPIFIDSLSFERYKEEPWIAFGQFCKHFLYPLLLMSKVDLHLNNLLRIWIDGIPGQLTEDLLPGIKKYFSLSYWLYLKLQNKAQVRTQSKPSKIQGKLKKEQLLRLIEGLRMAINSLKPKNQDTEWGNYYTFTNYTEASFEKKEALVKEFIHTVSPQSVWDLGANNGHFSRLASQQGMQTISFDIDPIAVEKNYLRARHEKDAHLLPLLLDLNNPSNGIGWAHTERSSIQERGPADLGLALALIHHLAIGNNVPLAAIASYFSKLFKALIIEFIPKEDSKVQELLYNRKDIFTHYTQNDFEKAFAKYFVTAKKASIEGSLRTLYLMHIK